MSPSDATAFRVGDGPLADVERLRALPTDKFMDLRQSGALNLIYAHLISLAQWDRLVALSMNRQMQLQNQAPEAANA